MARESTDMEGYLRARGDADIAAHSQRFFKTGKGQYGEGDRFLGIRVPELRRAVPLFRPLAVAQVLKHLTSPFHEVRLLAVLLLVDRYRRCDSDSERRTLYQSYLRASDHINN